VVGNPVNKSQGFRIHNRAFQHLKINHLYVNFLVEEVGSFVENFKEYIGGLSITMPHKHEIMKHIDHIDPQAQRIGAVNTVVKKNGHLTGYNTDCMAKKSPCLAQVVFQGLLPGGLLSGEENSLF